MSLYLQHEPEDGATVLVLRGDVVPEDAEGFRAELDGVLGTEARGVVIDLCRVRYLCSSALGSLARAYQSLLTSGRQLVITGLCPSLRYLFQATGLERSMRITSTREDAVRLLAVLPG